MIPSIAAPWRRVIAWLALAACLCTLAACVTRPRPPDATALPATYVRESWEALPGFSDDRVREAWPALLAGCRALLSRARDLATWQTPCTAAETIDGSDEKAVRDFLVTHFSPYAIASAEGAREGLVTGYFEPSLAGSRTATDRFRVPIHAVPDDLLVVDLASLHPELAGRRVRGRLEGRRVVPYPSRSEIVRGAAGAMRPLAFVEDPLDAFFLEVQGSGRIALTDGTVMRVGYADQNGHPYRAIANALIARGAITLEQASMQAIREWARSHPADVPGLLDYNPSYVFFREVPPPPPGSLEAMIDGPIGSLGVPLLAQRTIAVDARAIPLGAPVWISTIRPSTGDPIERLVLAQDTGGAIRGAVRADFFWGAGDSAAHEAGLMRARGRLWLLWPTHAALPGSPRDQTQQ